MTGYCLLDMAYEFGELGRYDEGHLLVLQTVNLARKHKYMRLLPAAQTLEKQLNAAMQRKTARAQH